MAVRISRLYVTDIYTDGAGYLGKINDIILNLETGKVVRITTEPLKNVSKERAHEVLRQKSVLYKNVKSVGDIMIVSKSGGPVDSVEEIEVDEQGKEKAAQPVGFPGAKPVKPSYKK